MNPKVYNFTQLKRSDQKIYAIGDFKINGGAGVEISYLLIVGPCFIFGVVLSFILSKVFGLTMNFLSPDFNIYYWAGMIGGFTGIGIALYKVPVAGYRLYEYLFAFMRKKKVYVYDTRRSIYRQSKYTINTNVKHLF